MAKRTRVNFVQPETPKAATPEVEVTVDDIQVAQARNCKIWGSDIVITQKDEVEYYNTVMKQVRLETLLVGSLTDDAEYLLSTDLKRDLVRMQKEIADESERYYVAFSQYMKKTFHFTIEVEDLSEDEVSASLYLNEQIVNYPYLESVKSFVASAKFASDENLKNKIFRTFNIVDGKPLIDDLKVPNLAVAMQKMLDEKLMIDQIVDIGAQIYVMRTLQVLENAGEIGQKIIEQYKREADELGLDTNEPGAYTTLQKVLDKAINDNGGMEKLPVAQEVKTQPMIEFTDSMKKVSEKSKSIEQKHKQEEKKDVKVEKTAPSAKKAGGGSAGKKTPAKKADGSDKGKGKKGGEKKAEKPKKKKTWKDELGKKKYAPLKATSDKKEITVEEVTSSSSAAPKSSEKPIKKPSGSGVKKESDELAALRGELSDIVDEAKTYNISKSGGEVTSLVTNDEIDTMYSLDDDLSGTVEVQAIKVQIDAVKGEEQNL